MLIATSFFFSFLYLTTACFFVWIGKRHIQRLAQVTHERTLKVETLQFLVKRVNDALITVGADGRVTTWDARAEAMTGLGLKDAEGRSIEGCLNLQDIRLSGATGPIARVIQQGKARVLRPTTLTARNGQQQTVTITILRTPPAVHPEGAIILLHRIVLPWGRVVDSITNEPINLAVVRVLSGDRRKVLETRVTDRHGRFSFLAKPGTYYVNVLKNGYSFPADAPGYQGEAIRVTPAASITDLTIPIEKILHKRSSKRNMYEEYKKKVG